MKSKMAKKRTRKGVRRLKRKESLGAARPNISPSGEFRISSDKREFNIVTSYDRFQNGPKIVKRIYRDGREEVLYDQSKQG